MEIPLSSIKECNYLQLNVPKANKNSHFYINYISSLGESRLDESKFFFDVFINKQ